MVGILIKRINGEWEAVKDAQEIALTDMCVATGEEGPRNEPIKSRTSLGYGLPVLNTACLAVRDGSAWEYEHVQQFLVSQPPSREELHSIVLHYNCYPTTMADGVRPERGLVY